MKSRAKRDSKYSLSRKVNPEGVRAKRESEYSLTCRHKKEQLLLLDLFPQLITTSALFRSRFDSLPVSRLRGRYIEG